MTIQKGDTVRCDKSCCSAVKGKTYTVSERMGIGDDADNQCSCTDKWTKINQTQTNNNMNLLEQFQNSLRSEPEKTFRKTGIVGSDGFLTSDGQKLFISFLLSKNGDEFKKEVVDPLVAEAEKEKA